MFIVKTKHLSRMDLFGKLASFYMIKAYLKIM